MFKVGDYVKHSDVILQDLGAGKIIKSYFHLSKVSAYIVFDSGPETFMVSNLVTPTPLEIIRAKNNGI